MLANGEIVGVLHESLAWRRLGQLPEVGLAAELAGLNTRMNMRRSTPRSRFTVPAALPSSSRAAANSRIRAAVISTARMRASMAPRLFTRALDHFSALGSTPLVDISEPLLE